MASLTRKSTSRFFIACFTDADGRQVQRSTKLTDRRKAQVMAEQWEKAARLAREKRLGEAQARKVIADIYEELNGAPLASSTAREFLAKWAESRKADTAKGTWTAYAQIAREFTAFLDSRADLDLSQVTSRDIARYRDSILARASAASANKHLKYLRVALGQARKDGFIQTNPAADVDTLRRPVADRQRRRPFTLPELRRVLDAAAGEWRGMLLFGLYTGQRLADLARLTWQNLDLTRRELRLVAAKTGRRVIIPLARPLLDHIATLDATDDNDAPLFPGIAAQAADPSRLSRQFHAILADAGLVESAPVTHAGTGKGRNAKRKLSPLSFHSLRHTATSFLKNAGAANSIAQDIIGHDTAAVSDLYTHADEAAKRRAIDSMPDITVATRTSPAKSRKTQARGTSAPAKNPSK